ncbi:MAG: hypothetical protein ACRDMH_00880 [Solirubrobacterales bacterium]
MATLAAGFALAVPLAALLPPALAHAKPGDLDRSFGNDGKVITDFGGGVGGEITSEVIDSRGRIVAAGFTRDIHGHGHFTLARYRSNGSLDPSFGAGGISTSFDGVAFAVTIDRRGRILAAGDARGQASGTDFEVVRYHSDGSPDASFGTGGLVTTDFGGGEYAHSVAIDRRGRIVVTGQHRGFAVARYTADGSLDPSFSGDGKATTDLHAIARGVRATSGAIDSRNRIYVAGYARTSSGANDFVIVRYRPDGAISRSFGRRGKVTTDFGHEDDLEGIAIDSRGRLVAAGSSGSRFAVARYKPDGKLSRSFGDHGKVTTRFGWVGSADDVAIDSRGRIIAAGYRAYPVPTDEDDVSAFAVSRYRPDGSLDRSFGHHGKVTTTFGSGTLDEAFAVAIDPQDRIVAAGYTDGDYAVARYVGYR